MIDTLHTSVLQRVLCALGPVDIVRLASCSKSLKQSIKFSACRAILIPILRERLKDACWSLLQAGYCIHVSNTLASYISSANSIITFTYRDQLYNCDYLSFKEFVVNNRKMFGEVFDYYIIHPNARLQRSNQGNRPTIRVKNIEKHFARCAEQLWRVATDEGDCCCSMCRPIKPINLT